jgi:hypothetical protein
MIRPILAAAVLGHLATPVSAADLFGVTGNWVGEGSLSTGADRPMERGRCKVGVEQAEAGDDVAVKGKCVVAAGASDISLRVVRGEDGKVSAGFWSAATDQIVQLSGDEAGGAIDLFSTSPLMVDDTAYETWVKITAPDDASFAIQQMLRAEGAEAWRMVVDMTYTRAGG